MRHKQYNAAILSKQFIFRLWWPV